MARIAQGWTLRKIGRKYYVRFRLPSGERCELTTGQSDPGLAQAEAARIYAERLTPPKSAPPTGVRLDEAVAEWLVSLVTHTTTIETYHTYAVAHWLPRWPTLQAAAAGVGAYRNERLKKVLAGSLSKELGALFGLFEYAHARGWLDTVPERPTWARSVKGTRFMPPRVGHVLEPAEVQALLAATPWRTPKGLPAQARFTFAYETGLRPSTLDAISWEDVDLQHQELEIRDEIDKARFGRRIPLSVRALDVLHRLHAEDHPEPTALVFGARSYRKALLAAARKSGIPRMHIYRLRHARGTHLLGEGASLPGVAYLLGHKQMTTTNKYTRPLKGAAEAAIRESDRLSGEVSGEVEPGSIRNQGDRRGSNPRQLEPQGSEPADLSRFSPPASPETDGLGRLSGEVSGELSIGKMFAADVIRKAHQEDTLSDEWGECVAAALAGDEARYLEHALPLVRALWGA